MLSLFFLTALVLLGYRLVHLQVFRHEELREKAKNNTQRVIARVPLRGQIRDIRGVPLATSIQAKIICADPKMVGERYAEMAQELSPLLEMEESDLAAAISLTWKFI